jgi:hypothetical protein
MVCFAVENADDGSICFFFSSITQYFFLLYSELTGVLSYAFYGVEYLANSGPVPLARESKS